MGLTKFGRKSTGNTKPQRIKIGYSRQFISALAFFERVNIGDMTIAIHIKEKIIKRKHKKNSNPLFIYREPLKNILAKTRLRAIPVRPRKVLAKTLPIIMLVNLEGQQNKFSSVPAYLSLSMSPAEEKHMELHKLVRPLPKIT
nr:hypothetical protein [Clostridium estertheticum]